LMLKLPPVTLRMYPPFRTPVTCNVIVPEAVPLVARSPTTHHPPATLVRVMVWPSVSWIFCEAMVADCCSSWEVLVFCGADGEAAIAGYAKSRAITANAPTMDAIAIFFVFILVRAFLCAVDI